MIVRRGALTDHYAEDERSVVMVDESVLGLSPIATAILQAVPEGHTVSLESVTDHVVTRFGPPAGPASAEDITRQQVWDLVAHKVLEVVDDTGFHGRTPSLLHHRVEDLSDGTSPAAVSALRAALRHLRSSSPGTWSAPESVSAAALVAAARQHHVVPYLAAHLDRLTLPDQARSQLEAMAGRQRAGATLLSADLSAAMDALGAFGVRALAFKGVTLATQAHGDFSIRGAGDLDLLVAPVDLARAHRALSGAGWRPAPGYPIPGPSWGWRHFARTGSELTMTSTHSEIDLHWHLVPTRGTFPDFDVLWSRHQIVSVAGHPVTTLGRYDALTHSAGHAAKDRWRWLRNLLDVHALMSEPETWLGADRPLRPDQILTVGLAAIELGTPPGVPPVVSRAAGSIDLATLERVRRDQVETAPEHRPYAVPGLNFLRGLEVTARTGHARREVAPLVSRSLLPPWLTASEQSPHAWVAVPRILGRRAQDLLRKGAIRKRSAQP